MSISQTSPQAFGERSLPEPPAQRGALCHDPGGQGRGPAPDLVCGPSRSACSPGKRKSCQVRQTQTLPRVPAVRIQHLCPRRVKKQNCGEGQGPGLGSRSGSHHPLRLRRGLAGPFSWPHFPSKPKEGAGTDVRDPITTHQASGVGLALHLQP